MSAWKLVPVEPTEEMAQELGSATWSRLLSASPDPATNEALVERVARAIAGSAFDERDRRMWRSLALVAIRALEEKP